MTPGPPTQWPLPDGTVIQRRLFYGVHSLEDCKEHQGDYQSAERCSTPNESQLGQDIIYLDAPLRGKHEKKGHQLINTQMLCDILKIYGYYNFLPRDATANASRIPVLGHKTARVTQGHLILSLYQSIMEWRWTGVHS